MQARHLDGSCAGLLLIIVIALLGHFFEQSPHPTQFSSRSNSVGSINDSLACIDLVLPLWTLGMKL
jgi:hypothetical protein